MSHIWPWRTVKQWRVAIFLQRDQPHVLCCHTRACRYLALLSSATPLATRKRKEETIKTNQH